MEENKDTVEEKKGKEQEETFDVKKEILSWIRMLAIVVVVVIVLTQVVFINAKVPSGSMENTIQVKDRLIGFRFSYWFDEPERGDIILFKYPVDTNKIYIKRVIGLPGETVEIRDGQVYIDGSDTPLEESYIKEEWVAANDGLYYEVPEDCYFVMGDNRNNSADSRYWAQEAVKAGLADSLEDAEEYTYVPEKNIEGKAIFTYFRTFRWLNKDVYEEN